jgi:hypothetical protein
MNKMISLVGLTALAAVTATRAVGSFGAAQRTIAACVCKDKVLRAYA